MSRLPRLAAGAAAALLLLAAPAAAHAVYQCGPQTDDCQCGMNNPYPCCDNGGNCTWWAWEAACCNWGIGLPGWGNANQWAGNARANGGYRVEGWPVVGAVSCRASGEYGHVAYVIGLNGGGVRVSEQNCWGNYGMRVWDYASSGWWDGGFITPNGRVECRPGDSQTQGCGRCGTQGRGCGNDGRWGAWGGCGGEGPCASGEAQEQGCGNCGKQRRTCGGDCQWGAWDACAGEAACPAGTTQSEPCGPLCATRSRACNASCQWDEFGACGGEGPCEVGATDEQPCGDCGVQSRTCDEQCQWGAFGECVSASVDAGFKPCSTGQLGACRAGERACVAGVVQCLATTAPAPEACNGLDDDCDGETDEELECPDAGLPVAPARDGGSAVRRDGGAGTQPPEGAVVAGCGCTTASGASAFALAFLALAAARHVGGPGRRRRTG